MGKYYCIVQKCGDYPHIYETDTRSAYKTAQELGPVKAGDLVTVATKRSKRVVSVAVYNDAIHAFSRINLKGQELFVQDRVFDKSPKAATHMLEVQAAKKAILNGDFSPCTDLINDAPPITQPEMGKLAMLLTEARIPFQAVIQKIGDDKYMQIISPSASNWRIDVICHPGSYGFSSGLLEIMRRKTPKSESACVGYLHAEEALEYFREAVQGEG